LSKGGAGQIFSVTAGSTGWLTVNPLSGVLPAALVNPAGLASGIYSGVVVVEANTGLGATSQNVIVTLTVADASADLVSPLAFTYQAGGTLPASQVVPVTAGLAGEGFSLTTSSADRPLLRKRW
jgi:hypothetical protein